jgi:hypothetical protein
MNILNNPKTKVMLLSLLLHFIWASSMMPIIYRYANYEICYATVMLVTGINIIIGIIMPQKYALTLNTINRCLYLMSSIVYGVWATRYIKIYMIYHTIINIMINILVSVICRNLITIYFAFCEILITQISNWFT